MLPSQLMMLRAGEQYAVEDDTEKRLAEARRTLPPGEHDPVYLSREQEILRRQKEVMNMHGVPDGRLMQGLYKRVHNPEAGNRPRGMRMGDDHTF